MPMRAARFGGKTCDEYVRTKRADNSHHVAENLLAVPDAKRFFVVLGKTKIICSREKLTSTIDAARAQQFLRANHSELFAQFRSAQILSAITACQREISGAITTTARQVGDQARVFVVRMSCDVKHRAHLAKAPKLLENRS